YLAHSFFNYTSTTHIYTLSLHDALPISPSGSGKTTIVKHLLIQKQLCLDFSISATSRYMRGDEVNGKDYYFISPTEFQEKIAEKDRKSTRLNSSHVKISYAVFCLKKKIR